MTARHLATFLAITLLAHTSIGLGCGEEDLVYLEGAPAWSGDRFGWHCDDKLHPGRACKKAKAKSPGILPAQDFLSRNALRYEEAFEDVLAPDGSWASVTYSCNVVMRSRAHPDLPELTVLTLDAGEQSTVVDSLCQGMLSPDGTLLGIGYGWTDDVDQHTRARIYTIEHLEALYWDALGRRVQDFDRPSASTYFHHALALNPDLFMARYRIARLEAISGHRHEALVQLTGALSMSPKKLRALARKDEAFLILSKDERFQLLLKGNHGWKKVQAEIGAPRPDALPPALG